VRIFAIEPPSGKLITQLAEAENRPKSAHRYNVAEQQQIYKSEIERIWKAQYDSLSRKDEPQLSDDEDKKDPKKQLQIKTVGSIATSPTIPGPVPPLSPAFSRGSSLEQDREGSLGPDGNRKVMRIRRRVRVTSRICRYRNVSHANRLMGCGPQKSSVTLP